MNTDEKRRIIQLETNMKWLLGHTDEICYALCPDFIGTWQERAKAAVKAARATPVALPPYEEMERRCLDIDVEGPGTPCGNEWPMALRLMYDVCTTALRRG